MRWNPLRCPDSVLSAGCHGYLSRVEQNDAGSRFAGRRSTLDAGHPVFEACAANPWQADLEVGVGRRLLFGIQQGQDRFDHPRARSAALAVPTVQEHAGGQVSQDGARPVRNTVAGDRSSSVTADPEKANRRAMCTYVTSLLFTSVVTALPSHEAGRRWGAVGTSSPVSVIERAHLIGGSHQRHQSGRGASTRPWARAYSTASLREPTPNLR